MHPLSLARGRYVARFSRDSDHVERAQRLRGLAFAGLRAGHRASDAALRDADAHDARCLHVLIEEAQTGTPVCCFRLLPLSGGSAIGRSYCARFYELSSLSRYRGRLAEVGRFCIHPDRSDPDILRIAWGALARFVDAEAIDMLFGCTSFIGTDWQRHKDAFAILRDRHLAPARWRPGEKAPELVRFASALDGRRADPGQALLTMPPLLRSYLAMGGRVSDHAVMDRDLGTLHVFTGLEIRAIPPARARLLRAIGACAVDLDAARG